MEWNKKIHGRKTGKSANTWKLNRTLLNNQLFKETTRETRNALRQMKTPYQELWDAAKALVREEVIAVRIYEEER